MGLDMFFTGRCYLWNFDGCDRDRIAAVAKVFPEAAGARIQQVEAEFQYWRKANQIHRWFVDNVQDGVDECKEHFVPVEKLYELRDACAAVIADRSQAEHLLPAQRGFFFGGTEYDEHYYDDVERTLKWLNGFLDKEALAALKGWDFYYRASW